LVRPDDRLPGGGRQVPGGRGPPWCWQALDQNGQDEDRADDGGDGAGGAPDQRAEPEGEQAEHGQVETGAKHGADRCGVAEVRFDAVAGQDGLPVKNAANEDAIPVTEATAKTAALAASTVPRWGAAAKVERIDPVAYSLVMITTPSTAMASWAGKKPLRL
jgi:hypothetical protein